MSNPLPLSDTDYLRYGRQILLPDWGESGQQQLLDKRVMVIGLGGLGCPALQYLAGAGVGGLIVADGDRVSLSNLPRQILYRPDQIGENKAHAAQQWVNQHNPAIKVEAIPTMVTEPELRQRLVDVDLVLDCTDNSLSRHLINRVCVAMNMPLVSAAGIGWQGQLLAISNGGPCFHCLSGGDIGNQTNCSEAGVVGPVLGAIASMQALLALQLLLGHSITMALHRFDGQQGQWARYDLAPNPHCEVCGTQPHISEISS